MIGIWLRGLLRARLGRLAGMVLCLACAVALLVDLGLFIDQSGRAMTQRALQTLSTDFQSELATGADEGTVSNAILHASPRAEITKVGYAGVDAFELTTGVSTQTTGPGKAVGIPNGYFEGRANDIRVLSGDLSGAVLLQQTAANLHAQVGDTVALHRPSAPDVTLTITGIADLRSADTFFQAIGVPAGAAPTAPPDNAVLMPLPVWEQAFADQAAKRPYTVRNDLHVLIDRSTLPSDPNAAYVLAANLGRNIEARLAGMASLSNNLAAQLDAARGDALYAEVLFLFLGAPGVVLAALLTVIIERSGQTTRARDQALLRQHGVVPSARVFLALAEAALIGIAGAILGLGIVVLSGLLWGGLSINGASTSWLAVGAAAGLILAAFAITSDASMPLRWGQSIERNGHQPSSLRRVRPLWQRLYLDVTCIALAAVVFWQTAASGYQVVLAAEGVTATSVNYTAFLAPFLLWIGGGLFTLRLLEWLLRGGKSWLKGLFRVLAGTLAAPVAGAMSWQRARLALATALVTLAIGFLVSTAIFNSTYQAQARVDAELTNGADATVSGSTASAAGNRIDALRSLSGVTAVQPMQHRFAYVGTDLQDLYGIDPMQLGTATDLSNAYFANQSAARTMADLAARQDAVLVSEETVNDFQLQLGDTLNLRLQGADHAYHTIPFTFTGVVREFPTAPHDSFLVANASYVAKATGIAASEVVLMKTSLSPDLVKAQVQQTVAGTGMQVISLQDAVRTIGSNLTAVDLKGLTQIELAFAVVLGLVATGLNLSLGFADRQRDFAVLRALGASRPKLAKFVWSEALVVVVAGVAAGAILGAAVAEILIIVLQGVFDPPPEFPSIPFGYLLLTGLAFAAATALAVVVAVHSADRNVVVRMREDR